MACALWLKHLGFAPVIIEPGEALGGQLLKINRVNRWVLGILGNTGPELAALYAKHIQDEAIAVRLNAYVESVLTEEAGFGLALRERGNAMEGLGQPESGHLSARAIVIATGLRLKSQEFLQSIPGASGLHESGLLSFFPSDHLEPPKAWEGKRVAVIGGGDNALFTAKDLAPHAASTHLLVRSQPRAQPALCAMVEDLARQGKVQIRSGAQITRMHIGTDGIVLTLINSDGKPERTEVDRIFARTGFAPNTDFLAMLGPLAGLAKNTEGYLRVDGWKRASLPGVYAIGDIANPDHPAVVTAIADGAVAARAIALDLGAYA
jgi:thioredoxin reductase